MGEKTEFPKGGVTCLWSRVLGGKSDLLTPQAGIFHHSTLHLALLFSQNQGRTKVGLQL